MRNMENLPVAVLYADGLEDSELPRDCMSLLSQTPAAARPASTPGERRPAHGTWAGVRQRPYDKTRQNGWPLGSV